MSFSKKIILMIGLIWCALCALFPPRQYIDSVHDGNIIPNHCYLFSPRFQEFFFQQGLGNYYSVDVNGGRLLAELVLISVITGIIFLWEKELTEFVKMIDAQDIQEPPKLVS